MTKKRFKLSYPNGVFLIDGDKPLCHMENDLMIVDLLNELGDENEQLKSVLKELKEIGDYQADRIQELNDENEQLKEENKVLKVTEGEMEDYLARIEEENKELKQELLETIDDSSDNRPNKKGFMGNGRFA